MDVHVRTSYREYVAIFFRRKYLIITTFLLVFACVLVWIAGQPKLFRSSALIQVEAKTNPLYDELSFPTIPDTVTVVMNALKGMHLLVPLAQHIQETMQGIEPHSSLLDKTPEDIAVSLRDYYISIEMESKDVLRVSCLFVNPQIAADTANQLIALYIKEREKSAKKYSEATVSVLEKERGTVKTDIEKRAGEIEEIKKKHGILSIDNFETQSTLRKEQLRNKRLENQLEMKRSTAKLLMFAKELENLRQESRENGLNPLADDIIKKEMELDIAMVKYTTDHPQVKKLREELAAFKKRKQNLSGNGGIEAYLYGNPVFQRLKGDIIAEAVKNDALKGEGKELIILMEQLDAEVASKESAIRILRERQESKQILEEKHALYGKKIAEAQLLNRLSQDLINISVIDPAVPPKHAYMSHVARKIMVGFIVALLAAVGLALLLDLFDTRITSTEDVERCVRYPVVGSIPFGKK